MSDKLPKSNNTDEVDLGKVFSYIEKLFIKIGQIFAGLFAFLGSILKNLGVFFKKNLSKKTVYFGKLSEKSWD
mgnify:CR=1 FL=1